MPSERVVFGRPIGQNQGIAFPLAEAKIRLEAADPMLQKAAWLIDHGLPCGAEANEAKWLAAEAGFYAADVALQVHGGYGYGKEYHVERYFREARLHADRADQPGDGPELRRRARPCSSATELLMRGLYYEEFEVGRNYQHAFRRTITEMDNVLFTSLTMNVQPLHLDEEFAKTTIHGQRLVNSLFTLALVNAYQIPELTMGTTLGNLGYEEVGSRTRCSTATRCGARRRSSASAYRSRAPTPASCSSSMSATTSAIRSSVPASAPA